MVFTDNRPTKDRIKETRPALVERFAAEGTRVVAADVEPVALDNPATELQADGAEGIGVQWKRTFGVNVFCVAHGVGDGRFSMLLNVDRYIGSCGRGPRCSPGRRTRPSFTSSAAGAMVSRCSVALW